jgi:hypothetical protein
MLYYGAVLRVSSPDSPEYLSQNRLLSRRLQADLLTNSIITPSQLPDPGRPHRPERNHGPAKYTVTVCSVREMAVTGQGARDDRERNRPVIIQLTKRLQIGVFSRRDSFSRMARFDDPV